VINIRVLARQLRWDVDVDVDDFRKPKNARSKRALEAREPKEVEDARTVIFVKGTSTGDVLNGAMKELVRSCLFPDTMTFHTN
jgi:hypothetical protein